MSSRISTTARVTAVASGKGGVGKTNISVNMAVAMAKAGRRTLLVDCDMGLANAGILMGLDTNWTLADVLARHCELGDIVRPGPGGVCLVPGHSGIGIGSALSERERHQLIEALRQEATGFEEIVIDTGSGIGSDGLSLVAAADTILIVLVPEPTSFMDAYAVVKGLAVGHGSTAFSIVTNMVENDEAGRELFDHFRAIIGRFLKVELTHLGSIPQDPYVKQAVVRKRCCIEAYPSSRAGRAFTRLARQLSDQRVAPIQTAEAVHGAC